MNRFLFLFSANAKMIYRDRSALFWTLVIPIAIYSALALIPIGALIGNDFSYKDFVLPGIITYVIMQGGIYGLAYWMVDLRTRGVIKRLLVTPVKTSDFVLSLITSRITVIFIQIILLTLLGVFVFHAKFAGNILSILAFTLLGGSIFLLIGLLISNFSNSYQTAAPITAAIGLPFTFLGDVFIPLQILPKPLQTLAHIFPITYLADGLRQAYTEPFNVIALSTDLFVLILWLVAILIITLRVFKLKEE